MAEGQKTKKEGPLGVEQPMKREEQIGHTSNGVP